MRTKTMEDYEKEIEELRNREKILAARTSQITLSSLPTKDKELLDLRQRIKEKKEEIKRVTELQREDLRALEKGYRDCLKMKGSLEYERSKAIKEQKAIPVKIEYRLRKLEELRKNFNPSKRRQTR